MMKRSFAIGNLFVCAVLSPIAHSSSDNFCQQSTNLKKVEYSCSSAPFLSPSNDTALNLQLLMADASKLQVLPLSASRLEADSRPAVPFDFPNQWHVIETGMPGAEPRAFQTDGPSDEYAEGEGSRCRTMKSGAVLFREAISAASKDIPLNEANSLIERRDALLQGCFEGGDPPPSNPLEGIQSPLGLEFGKYLVATEAFYDGRFKDARKAYSELSRAQDPWLRETSSYMVARTDLNVMSGLAFDSTSLEKKSVDSAVIGAARASLSSYLRLYPQGVYTNSARGLLRRIDWLADDQTKLDADYAEILFSRGPPKPMNATMLGVAAEADRKLLNDSNLDRVHTPELLAVMDLARMRWPYDAHNKHALTWPLLQAQKSTFSSKSELYTYLLAAYRYYVEQNWGQVLALLPATSAAPNSYLSFSEQTLRGFALEKSGRAGDAQDLWRSLIARVTLPLQREQLQLALAMNQERAKQIGAIFSSASPVTDEGIRHTLIEQAASAEQLRGLAKDQGISESLRNDALQTLLAHEFLGDEFEAFVHDLGLAPETPSSSIAPFLSKPDADEPEYSCPTPREVATELARHSDDSRSLNCWAEFLRTAPETFRLMPKPGPEELGGTLSLLASMAHTRMERYMTVISHSKDTDARAYALFRAIRCFAPSGYNECGEGEIPQSTRKAWFRELKLHYPNTTWSKQLQYYW